MSPPCKIETVVLDEKLKYPTIRSVLDKDLVTNDAFSLEFYPDLRIGIGFIQNNKHYTLINHVGDLISLPLTSNQTENRLSITKYKALIEYSFKRYSDSFSELKESHNFFTVNLFLISQQSKLRIIHKKFLCKLIHFKCSKLLNLISTYMSCEDLFSSLIMFD